MKTLPNTIDRWLIKNWARAHELEESMNRVRQQYEGVFELVVERVREEMPDLDYAKIHTSSYGGNVGFARQVWRKESTSWPSGIWIGDIGLEILTAPRGGSPNGHVWIRPKEAKMSMDKAKAKIAAAASKVMRKERLRWHREEPSDSRVCMWYEFKESRQSLIDMLLDGDSSRFVQCMVGHVSTLAQFIPILDGILIRGR